MPESSKPRRRWYQYRLRTLFVLMLLASLGLSWLAVKLHQAQKQREAVAAIRWRPRSPSIEVGKPGAPIISPYCPGQSGFCYYRQVSWAPQWLRRWCGQDCFDSVWHVDLPGDPQYTQYLLWLPQVEDLTLKGLQLNDAALECVSRCQELRRLEFASNQVTDAGLRHLRWFTKLQDLTLVAPQVTDAGLEHLETLAGLKHLALLRTRVTGDGLKHLVPLAQLERLNLEGNPISDANLVHIGKMTHLVELRLDQTAVTDAGLAHLKSLRRLKDLSLDNVRIGDRGLEELKSLPALESLYVIETDVTSTGVQAFAMARKVLIVDRYFSFNTGLGER